MKNPFSHQAIICINTTTTTSCFSSLSQNRLFSQQILHLFLLRNYLDYLSDLCKEFDFLDSVHTYTSPDSLLADIKTGTSYNILLMDIDFNSEKNGIDYTTAIYRINPQIRIIYVTGYTERFVQHIFLRESGLVGFLTKPVQKDILAALLSKAMHQLDTEKQALLCTLGKGRTEAIPCSSILYIENIAHNAFIHTNTESYSVYEPLSSVCKRLPSNFYQCHKSYVVNMDKIRRIENQQIILTNQAVVPISRSHISKTKDTYFSYMNKSL